MERIEFGFFDAGGGHRAAATALEMAIQAQQRPWEVQLTNLQELLDPLDIVKKYAGIRIQDVYNTMLRTRLDARKSAAAEGVAAGDSALSPADGRLLEAHWKETRAGHGGFVRAAFQSRAWAKVFAARFQDAHS